MIGEERKKYIHRLGLLSKYEFLILIYEYLTETHDKSQRLSTAADDLVSVAGPYSSSSPLCACASPDWVKTFANKIY